ncbi:hypothetical protein [Nonlabens ulvanivorans]|uniref:hypothetical protein n=2 Tax=Flavobacteriales TaxID=200644 RepID=UPI0032662B3E
MFPEIILKEKNELKMNTFWKIFGIFLFAGISFVIWIIVSYLMSIREMNHESKMRQCDFEKTEMFVGIISRIDRYEYYDYMNERYFGLEIKVHEPNDTILDYQFEIEYFSDLLKNVKVGDTIIKRANRSIFSIKNNNEIKYLVPNCDE